MPRLSVMRHVEIDMGHRVMRHAGKCKNFHGHRYRIEATFGGLLQEDAQDGMVADFSFMKEVLQFAVHDPFDHALCLGAEDPWLQQVISAGLAYSTPSETLPIPPETSDLFRHFLEGRDSYARMHVRNVGTVCVIADTPTAENLARLWFYGIERQVLRMANPITFPNGNPIVEKVRVWETPNCYAEYRLA